MANRTSGGLWRPMTRRWAAMPSCALVAAWLALLSGGAAAQTPLKVELDAPASVRPLLEQHLHILRDEELTLPAEQADRVALARRTRREAADLLATEGYFTPEIDLQRGPDRWRLAVVPGPQAKIAAVELSFAGDLAGEGDARATRRASLRGAWQLVVGQPFRQAAWDDAKAQLLDGVAVRDYAAARIDDSRAEVDPDSATVRLSVTIDSGPRFYLGPLQVTGLERLPPNLVRRFNMLDEGEPFDQERLLALQTALQNSPQFASVVVDIDRDPALAAAVPVRVQVTEARSRNLGFGAGYSTNNGFRVEVSWRDVNLFDRGWELSSGVRLEQRRQAAYADVFLPPARAGHRDSFGTALERSNVEGLKLTTQAIGVARTKTRGNIDTRIALRLQHERREPEGAESSDRNALTANWTWTRRRVDDLLDPRRGDVLQVEVGGGAKAALSDQDFLRLYGRYVHYWTVAQRDVLILRGEGGMTLAPSRDGVPQDFLFRAGGSQSVRGYAFQSLGVKEGDATVGGRYLGTLSAEYVRWFRPQWGAAVFADAGDAADSRDGFRLRTGYGAGARWKSPAGPLAVDVAYGTDDRRMRLHFGIAIAF